MENEELTGTKVPHLKVTGTVTKFPWKSNFPIPVILGRALYNALLLS